MLKLIFLNFLDFLQKNLAKILEFCRNFHRTLIAIVRSVRSLADRTFQPRRELLVHRTTRWKAVQRFKAPRPTRHGAPHDFLVKPESFLLSLFLSLFLPESAVFWKIVNPIKYKFNILAVRQFGCHLTYANWHVTINPGYRIVRMSWNDVKRLICNITFLYLDCLIFNDTVILAKAC